LIIKIVLFLIAAVVFIVLAVYLGATLITESPKAELRRRLRRMANQQPGGLPEDLRSEIIKEIPPFDRVLSKIPYFRDLDKKLDQAGLKIPVTKFVMIVSVVALSTFILSWIIIKIFLVSLGLLILILILPSFYLSYLKNKRVINFTEIFPEALTMTARSLRAGHSLTSAVQLVGQEISEPVGGLFKTAYDQQFLGLRLIDALANMNERIESLDLRFFTTAVGINTEVGGNLAEILDKLAETIRERVKIRRQVRVYTAQARISGYVLAFLPVIAFILFRFMLPGYEEELLNTTKGIYVLISAGVMQVIGFLVIRKIINIRI
jgi:tight adherence protein B